MHVHVRCYDKIPIESFKASSKLHQQATVISSGVIQCLLSLQQAKTKRLQHHTIFGKKPMETEKYKVQIIYCTAVNMEPVSIEDGERPMYTETQTLVIFL